MLSISVCIVLVSYLIQPFLYAQPTAAGRLWSSSFAPPRNASYDYVVIGGGTAGNAIAARLAEDPAASVAVVEAGGFYEVDNGNGSVVPALCYSQYTGTVPGENMQSTIDWDYSTTPQRGAAGRRIFYPRGKTLGGSSARNFLSFHRATKGAFQTWADMVGDQSYTFPHMLPYFKRSSTFTKPNMNTRFSNSTSTYDLDAWDNSLDGPVQASYPNYADSFSTWAMVAFPKAGMPMRRDGFDSGELLGCAWTTNTIEPSTQERSSSQTAYLSRAMKNTGLQVYTYTLAKRILFDDTKTARHVEVETGGLTYYLDATKEVILSGGVFNSPQTLMLSGVGPKETLGKFGIPCISDLPGVGQNKIDQPVVTSAHRVNLITSSVLLNDAEYAAQQEAEYLTMRTGVFTDAGTFAGFEKIPASLRKHFSTSTETALSKFPSDWPEVEHIAVQALQAAYQNSFAVDPVDGYNYASITTILTAPLSRGNLTIRSPDPHIHPLVDPCWLCNPGDVEVALAAFKREREIWATAAFAKLSIGPEYWPGPGNRTDEQILETIRNSVRTIYHAAGTCAMGKPDDKMAVVDTTGRVYGVHRLRVVDASIFPLLPPGHPTSTVYAIAEKVAEDIKMRR